MNCSSLFQNLFITITNQTHMKSKFSTRFFLFDSNTDYRMNALLSKPSATYKQSDALLNGCMMMMMMTMLAGWGTSCRQAGRQVTIHTVQMGRTEQQHFPGPRTPGGRAGATRTDRRRAHCHDFGRQKYRRLHTTRSHGRPKEVHLVGVAGTRRADGDACVCGGVLRKVAG